MNPQNPLIVQSNSTILLEVNNTLFADARNAISLFAHLDKSPEYIHTYSITPLSLWNAASLGMTPLKVVDNLSQYSKYPLPQNVVDDINELMGRFGKITIESFNGSLVLYSDDSALFILLAGSQAMRSRGLCTIALARHNLFF
jgi:DNA excision repair protein ERCC-3